MFVHVIVDVVVDVLVHVIVDVNGFFVVAFSQATSCW
jgi:hypothetical protein